MSSAGKEHGIEDGDNGDHAHAHKLELTAKSRLDLILLAEGSESGGDRPRRSLNPRPLGLGLLLFFPRKG